MENEKQAAAAELKKKLAEQYGEIHQVEVRVKGEVKTLFFKEPDLAQWDAYVSASRTNPILATQAFAQSCIVGLDEAEKKAVCGDKRVIVALFKSGIADAMTEDYVAELKKSEN